MVKRALLLFGVSISLVVSHLGGLVTYAADDFDYSVATTITISEDYTSTVETIIKAEQLKSGAQVPSSITIPVYGQNPKAVSAELADNKEVDVSIVDAGARIALNALQGNPEEDWSLKLRYSSSAVIAIGKSYIAMIPSGGFESSTTIASESKSIVTAPELGSFVTRGSQPSETSSIAGERVTTWQNKTGPLDQSVGVLFGDNTQADLSFNATLTNDSWWWRTESVVLPPDTNQQRVFIDSISPKPSAIHLDEDGNSIVEYMLRPKQSIEVSANIRAVVSSYIYSIEDSLLINDIEPLLIERYTSLSERWADSSLTFENVDTRPVAEVVEEIYDTVSAEYAENQSQDSFEASRLRSDRLVGELRANSIPAREVIGAVYGDGTDIILQANEQVWVEAYVPGVGWMSLDPAFEQNGDYFGVADIQRVALSIRGILDDFPPRSLENYIIGFSSSEPPSAPVMTPIISSTKHMVFPGVAIHSTTVSMPAGVIVDGAGLAFGQNEFVSLGSLAPLQEITIRKASFLANAFTSESVQYGEFDQSGQIADGDVIAQTTSSVSYVPMISVVLFICAIILIKLVASALIGWVRSKRSSKKPSDKKDKKRHTSTSGYDDLGDDTELLLSDIKTPLGDDSGNIESEPPVQQPAQIPLRQPNQANVSVPSSATMRVSSGVGVKPSNPDEIRSQLEKRHPHKRRPPLIQ